MTTVFVSDQHYTKVQEIRSLTELAEYTAASVDGTRIGAKIVIPEFVTFQRFPERGTSKLEQAEPMQRARIRFEDYRRLRDTYRASGNGNPQVDSLVSMAESYM